MASDLRKIKIGVTLTVTLSLAIVLLAPSPVVPATTYLFDESEVPLAIGDLSALPPHLIAEASSLAEELFDDSQQKRDEFVRQLLAMYVAVKDKDVVFIFNPGGWGWSSVSATAEGESFINGVKSELDSMGYDSIFLNHRRTARTFNSGISEFMLAAGLYPPKAEDLAARVAFVTDNIAGIKVILAGVSNGTLICDGAMDILKDNRQVYSIQLGPPFWNGTATSDRSLIIRNNGVISDSFSQGDFFAIIRANIEALFGLSQQYPGDLGPYIGAPGHDYNWEYDKVRNQIIDFLWTNFGP